ncbi:MAG: hypothetical protein M1824_005201 [Vezdaea acicularis]|nr:MAG: hypothetical protein M1824_005201 [Vezdaea acicularis]
MPTPVPAHLASSLLTHPPRPRDQEKRRISTGYPAVDDALDGGFPCGGIIGLSGGPSAGKSLTTISFLLAHSSSDCCVAVIDTTGQFDVRWLFKLLKQRLRAVDHSAATAARRDGPDDGKGADEEALALMGRVKVMRVFDFAGVVEAVGEVREGLEGDNDRGGLRGQERGKELVVGDSQADDDEEGEEEDALDPTTRKEEEEAERGEKVGMLIVDNISNVLGVIMKQDVVQAQALLVSFTRSLSRLTRQHDLLTLLLNDAVGLVPYNPPPPKVLDTDTDASTQQHERPHQSAREDVSIFASSHGRPALGRTWGHCIDMQIWLSMQPREGGREVRVLEVVSEREGRGTGRWGILTERNGGD